MLLRGGFTIIPTLYHFPLDHTGYATLITVFFGYEIDHITVLGYECMGITHYK